VLFPLTRCHCRRLRPVSRSFFVVHSPHGLHLIYAWFSDHNFPLLSAFPSSLYSPFCSCPFFPTYILPLPPSFLLLLPPAPYPLFLLFPSSLPLFTFFLLSLLRSPVPFPTSPSAYLVPFLLASHPSFLPLLPPHYVALLPLSASLGPFSPVAFLSKLCFPPLSFPSAILFSFLVSF